MRHEPLHQPPKRVRPPYDEEDTSLRFADILDEVRHRKAVRADKLSALTEPLDGLELTPHELRILDWLTTWDVGTVGTIANLLGRARQAQPLKEER